MARELTPEQIQQLRAFQAGLDPAISTRKALRQANNSQISELNEAARLIGAGRSQGMSDDETIVALARQLVQEDDRRLARDPELLRQRQRLAESDLIKEGLSMDERDLKGSGQILREDNENMGYADYAEYEAAQREGKAALQLDENLVRAREVYQLRQNQVAAQPKNKFRQKQLQRAALKLEQAESAARDYAFGMNVYAAEGEDARPGALEDQMLRERQRTRVVDGQRGVMQGGAFYPNPEDAAVPVLGALRPARGEGFTPDDRNNRQRREKFLELVEGRAAKAQEERFFRGDLTEREMSERARIQAGVQANKSPLVSSTPQVGVPESVPRPAPVSGSNIYREAAIIGGGRRPNDRVIAIEREVPRPQPGVENYYRSGAGKGDEFDIRPQKPIVRHPFGSDESLNDVQNEILGQLRARKERSRSGVQDKIRLQNITRAGEEITGLLRSGGFPADVRAGNIINLGSVKDKRADLGVQLGNQRVTFPEAVRVARPDGSYEFYAQNDAVLGDLSFNDKPLPGQPLATSAEGLNAPIMGETAEAFVERNIYDNYGAQNFGTDTILPNLAERGGGGGIPQVSISNELSALEDAVANRLGVPKKGIRSVASLQAAADAVIADAAAKKRVMFNLQDGKKVFSENPGIAEVMMDLKIPPAQQQAIANALYQVEAGRRQDVNLDAKDQFFAGGRPQRPSMDGKTIITGVNDPARGGDRLDIQKADPKFAAALRAAGGVGDISPDAAKPFIAQLGGDPRRIQDNRQVFRGFDPVQVREQQERVARINAGKRKRQGKAPVDRQEVINKIRGMQEGNVMARFRAAQAEAHRNAEDRVDMGRIVPGKPIPAMYKGEMMELPGRARVPQKDAKLQPGPVRPREVVNLQPVMRPQPGASKPGPGELTTAEANKRKYARRQRPNAGVNPNPNVVEAPQIDLPAGYGERQASEATRPQGPTMRTGARDANQRMDQIKNMMTKFGMDPRTQKGRRRGYGTGAALAAALGVSSIMREEEEQV